MTQPHNDEELFVALREMWSDADPPPDGLADRTVAEIAVEDTERDFALLDLLEEAPLAEVRGEGIRRTVRFGDESSTIVLHIVAEPSGVCRIGGWSDPPVLAARLCQDQGETSAVTAPDGRFTFDDVPHGRSCMRVATLEDDRMREARTPWFET